MVTQHLILGNGTHSVETGILYRYAVQHQFVEQPYPELPSLLLGWTTVESKSSVWTVVDDCNQYDPYDPWFCSGRDPGGYSTVAVGTLALVDQKKILESQYFIWSIGAH